MKPHQHRKHRRVRTLRIIALTLLCAIAAAAAFAVPELLGRSPASVTIRIPENATESSVRDSLARHTSAEYAGKVMRFARFYGADFRHRAGAYHIPRGLQAFRAARRLARGAQTPVVIRINGFRDIDDLARRVSAKFRFTQADFNAYLHDQARLARAAHTPECAGVIFFDANYEFYWTDSERAIIDRFEKDYADFWTPRRRREASALGLRPDQVMIIASIVDEETTDSKEKGRIGRLYVNRLQKGMRLQADPTVKFALGDFSIKRVRRKHLAVQSPYNTYRSGGLPPGPIRTTSKATVDSVLRSRPSDDLYMCAREDLSGTHVFSPTFDAHLQAAEKYRSKIDGIGL